MKKTIIAVIIIIIGVVGYLLLKSPSEENEVTEQNTENVQNKTSDATTTVPVAEVDKTKTVIGQSVDGNSITAFHYGEGENEVLFVGGIHGGYGWNTALVAYEAMDYFAANSNSIPSNVKVTVIPVLNPDGLKKVVGSTERFVASDASGDITVGRFNANNVDLNRNFDCDWQAVGKWQNKDVSGGTAPFSESESIALKNYVEANNPSAVVVWYSAAGGVFASSCHNGVSADTSALTNAYAKASGYKAYQDFNFYEVTGDMVNWLAKKDIPAISVLLTNHTDTEWSKNLSGIKAVLASFAE